MRLGENLGRLFLMAGSEALKLLSPTRHFEKPNFFSVLPDRSLQIVSKTKFDD
jgi:hypothetical protein